MSANGVPMARLAEPLVSALLDLLRPEIEQLVHVLVERELSAFTSPLTRLAVPT